MRLMIQNTHITGNDLIVENGTSRYINTVTVIGNNDDSALQKQNKSTNYAHININKCKLFSLHTLSDTPRPKVTSPDTVKWSSSIISGILAKRPRNSFTFEKWFSPNFTSGVVGNIRCGDIAKLPFFKWYKFDMTNSKSEVFFTGKKRERGTLIPIAPSKHFIAAPTAVSNCTTRTPFSIVLLFTMISMLSVRSRSTRSIAV